MDDAVADEVIQIITQHAQTGEIGDGKIFLTDIGQVIRIRTGETGVAAV